MVTATLGNEVQFTVWHWKNGAAEIEADERYKDLLTSAVFINKAIVEKYETFLLN
jgi:hypothetical protein